MTRHVLVLGALFAIAAGCKVEQHHRADGLVPAVLIVDLDGNGVRLRPPASGILRDFGDGVRRRSGWPEVDTDDALVAVEKNRNGVIDDLSELVGVQGPPNGFDFLRALDGTTPDMAAVPGRRARRQPDGVIDARDEVFQRLTLWTDSNGDGRSAPGELQSFGYSGITVVRLPVNDAQHRFIGGGTIERIGSAIRTADGIAREIEIAEVRLSAQRQPPG